MTRQPRRLMFIQIHKFSNTNESLEEVLPDHLASHMMEVVKVWPAIKRNPLYLTLCVVAAVLHHGFRILMDSPLLNEAVRKTPTFFRLGSKIARRRIEARGDVSAVIQTQGLINAKVLSVPLIVYTDNTIRNSLNERYHGLKSPEALVELEADLYRNSDAIAVTATHAAQSLTDDYGIPIDRIHTVFVGSNAPRIYLEKPDRFERQRILFVGIDWERKGGPELITAFKMLSPKHPDATLTIVGCRPDVSLPNVRVLGKLPPDEVSRLMCASSIFCLPSLVEPSSVAVIEAARCGLPVVGTCGGGFLDSVRTEETGILVPPGDAESLSLALGRLLAAPEVCERMGREGARWVSQRFDWDTVCGKLARVILQHSSTGL